MNKVLLGLLNTKIMGARIPATAALARTVAKQA